MTYKKEIESTVMTNSMIWDFSTLMVELGRSPRYCSRSFFFWKKHDWYSAFPYVLHRRKNVMWFWNGIRVSKLWQISWMNLLFMSLEPFKRGSKEQNPPLHWRLFVFSVGSFRSHLHMRFSSRRSLFRSVRLASFTRPQHTHPLNQKKHTHMLG